jgi:lysophospholipase L1-like esterase
MRLFTKICFIVAVTCSLAACSEKATLSPLDADASILAFGDSLTYGTGTSRDKAYPAVLEKLIGRKVINAGIPGEVSKKGLARLPGLIEQYHPDLIILCHGANDILRKLDLTKARSNLQQMITLAKKSGSEVVLVAVPEFSLFLTPEPMYQALAEENQLPVTENILGEIIGNNSLKSDRVHPNAQGYQLLAQNIAALLSRSGAISP